MHKVINSGYSHTYQCPPKIYTAGLRQVSEATIIAQSGPTTGRNPGERQREKKKKKLPSVGSIFYYQQM